MVNLLGHTDQYCDKLLALEKDDGSRGWGSELKADLRCARAGRGGKGLKEEGVRGSGGASGFSGIYSLKPGGNGAACDSPITNPLFPQFSGNNSIAVV